MCLLELAVLVLRNRIGHPPINYAIYALVTYNYYLNYF